MARILKLGGHSGFGHEPQAIAFSFSDINDRAGQYVDQVRLEASRIMERAKQEAEALKRRAQEEGRQLALAAARKELAPLLDQQVQSSLQALKAAAAQLEHARLEWQRQWEGQAVHLACAIAARVIRRELAHDVDISPRLVREALEIASRGSRLKILLHPDEIDTLRPAVEEMLRELHGAEGEVAADPAVGRGGCRIVTEHGEIDQRIETQLARIEEELAA